jgi:hypothetical protein
MDFDPPSDSQDLQVFKQAYCSIQARGIHFIILNPNRDLLMSSLEVPNLENQAVIMPNSSLDKAENLEPNQIRTLKCWWVKVGYNEVKILKMETLLKI